MVNHPAVFAMNKSTKNTTFFNLFYYRVLGYLFIIQTKKLFFRLLFCTLVHMVYIASPALHRSKRSGSVKSHSRRRVCIVCGGKWVGRRPMGATLDGSAAVGQARISIMLPVWRPRCRLAEKGANRPMHGSSECSPVQPVL